MVGSEAHWGARDVLTQDQCLWVPFLQPFLPLVGVANRDLEAMIDPMKPALAPNGISQNRPLQNPQVGQLPETRGLGWLLPELPTAPAQARPNRPFRLSLVAFSARNCHPGRWAKPSSAKNTPPEGAPVRIIKFFLLLLVRHLLLLAWHLLLVASKPSSAKNTPPEGADLVKISKLYKTGLQVCWKSAPKLPPSLCEAYKIDHNVTGKTQRVLLGCQVT